MRAVLLAALSLLAALPAFAEDLPGTPAEGKKPRKEVICIPLPGLGGHYRCGAWMPVPLELRNTTDDDLTLRLSASLDYGDKGGVAAFGRDLDLPRGGRKALTLYLRPVQPLEGVRVECRSGRTGSLACSADLAVTQVRPGRALLLVAGPSGLSAYPAWSRLDAAAGVEGRDLPDRPEGYDAADWIVLRGATWAEDPVRLEALVQWLEAGGRAAVAGGEALHALAGGPLGRRLGLSLGEPTRLVGVPALQALAGEDLGVPVGDGILCEQPSCPGSEILSREGEVPLLRRAPLGAGELLLFGVDPEVFRGQPGYWGLWRGALGLPERAAGEEPEPLTVERAGLEWARDVLASRLFHRERIRLDWIWAFLGVYLLVVGPLDYFLVRRLKSLRLVGLGTLLLWSVAASVACYALGSSGRFTSTRVARLGVMDAFPEPGRVSGRALASVFHAGNGVFDVAPPWGRGSAAVVVDPANTDRSGMLSGETLSWEEGESALRLRRAPVYVGTQKIFETRWAGDWKALGLSWTRTERGWRLENRSTSTLREAAAGGRILAPGGVLELGAPEPFSRQQEGAGPLQAQLAEWLAKPPAGLPLRLSPRAGSARGFAFWVEGGGAVPLGVEGLIPDVLQEGMLLRIHPGG